MTRWVRWVFFGVLGLGLAVWVGVSVDAAENVSILFQSMGETKGNRSRFQERERKRELPVARGRQKERAAFNTSSKQKSLKSSSMFRGVVGATSRPSSRALMALRGMTISCFGWGAAWATPLMRGTMAELQKLGGNWVSFHPYAQIRNDGSLGFSTSLSQLTVLRPLRYAKELGVKILLKPHIGYWGSKFKWRGSIAFSDEVSWKRFFRDYTKWIVVQAKMAQKGRADMFSVGLEYIKMEHREADWRRVIAAVRRVYKGRIIYSANWDSYHKVKFWDALDVIGIQAYFPLSQKKNPSEADLRRGWEPILKTLAAFSKKHGKKIIFTELGFNRAAHTAARPWDHEEGGPNAAAMKLRCVKASLQRLSRVPFLEGVFLWKWFPSFWNISSNYTLQYPAMKRVLRNAWTRPQLVAPKTR